MKKFFWNSINSQKAPLKRLSQSIPLRISSRLFWALEVSWWWKHEPEGLIKLVYVRNLLWTLKLPTCFTGFAALHGAPHYWRTTETLMLEIDKLLLALYIYLVLWQMWIFVLMLFNDSIMCIKIYLSDSKINLICITKCDFLLKDNMMDFRSCRWNWSIIMIYCWNLI